MSSGVTVNDEVLAKYQELKLGKKTRFLIFGLSSDLTQVVALESENNQASATYDDFLKHLPADQCRWAVFDFEFETGDGGKRNKLVFYSWSPDDAKIKQKMLFASSKDALRRALVGIGAEIQGTDVSEVAEEEVLSKVKRGY